MQAQQASRFHPAAGASFRKWLHNALDHCRRVSTAGSDASESEGAICVGKKRCSALVERDNEHSYEIRATFHSLPDHTQPILHVLP